MSLFGKGFCCLLVVIALFLFGSTFQSCAKENYDRGYEAGFKAGVEAGIEYVKEDPSAYLG